MNGGLPDTNYRISSPSARVLCPDHLQPVTYTGAGQVECPRCQRVWAPGDRDLLNVYDAILRLKAALDEQRTA